MTNQEIAKTIISAGGSNWQKNGKNRVYVNRMDTWVNLVDGITRGQTNYAAEINGRGLSGKCITGLTTGAYYDINTGETVIGDLKGGDDRYYDAVDAIKVAIKALADK